MSTDLLLIALTPRSCVAVVLGAHMSPARLHPQSFVQPAPLGFLMAIGHAGTLEALLIVPSLGTD